MFIPGGVSWETFCSGRLLRCWACLCRRWGPANEAVGHIVDVQQLRDVGLVDEVLDAGVRVTTTIRMRARRASSM